MSTELHTYLCEHIFRKPIEEVNVLLKKLYLLKKYYNCSNETLIELIKPITFNIDVDHVAYSSAYNRVGRKDSEMSRKIIHDAIELDDIVKVLTSLYEFNIELSYNDCYYLLNYLMTSRHYMYVVYLCQILQITLSNDIIELMINSPVPFLMDFVIENICPSEHTSDLCRYFAEKNSDLYLRMCVKSHHSLAYGTISHILKNGNLNMLMFVDANNCNYDQWSIYEEALQSVNKECIPYVEKMLNRDYPVHYQYLVDASRTDNEFKPHERLQIAHDIANEKTGDPPMITDAPAKQFITTVSYSTDKIREKICDGDAIGMIRLMRMSDFDTKLIHGDVEQFVKHAIVYKRCECIVYLFDVPEFVLTENIMDTFDEINDTEFLENVIKNVRGGQHTTMFSEYFAKRNDLPHIQLCVENSHPLSPLTIMYALKHGNIDMLIYADEKKCPYDKLLIRAETLVCGNKECLEYVDYMLRRDIPKKNVAELLDEYEFYNGVDEEVDD